MATRTLLPVVGLEISNPLPPDGLAGHTAAHVVLCLHGRPLGPLGGRVTGRRLDLDALIPSVLEAHAPSLAAPLVERAMAIGSLPKWPEVAPLLACRPNALPCAPAVTIIVRTLGEPGHLRACLDAVQAVDYPSLSVVIADPGVPLSQALAQAGGDVVAFIDDAVVLDRGWVGAVVRVLVSDPEVAAVSGLTLPRVSALPLAPTLFDRRWHRGRHARVDGAPDAPLAVAFWRDALEPADLAAGCKQTLAALLRDGHSVVYEPSALAWHATRTGADPCVDGGADVSRLAVRRVDLGQAPRAIADAAAEDALRLHVTWDDHAVGELDLAHHGAVVSAFRIQDAVTRALAWEVLDARLRVGTPALRAILTAELARHLLVARRAAAAAPAQDCPLWIEQKPAAA